ncbi:unnamed protein product [Linum tenue]|uniref:Uncharacterized protein n=1 Tax=Linum tenue TaxID=586396 RepID=A0AAV0PUT2_9ROSI|nr:unnamed protein product [Linum tenue]
MFLTSPLYICAVGMVSDSEVVKLSYQVLVSNEGTFTVVILSNDTLFIFNYQVSVCMKTVFSSYSFEWMLVIPSSILLFTYMVVILSMGLLISEVNFAVRPMQCSSPCISDLGLGVPWTEEEHRLFLIGLQKQGKGDWRGIARNYVVSRTPTQVASHAQKYFIRQTNATRRKRRSSLFDMVPDLVSDPQSVPEDEELLPSLQERESNYNNNADSLPSLNLSLKSEYEPMETMSEEPPPKDEESNETTITVPRPTQSSEFPPIAPVSSEFTQFGFIPAFVPVPYPFWTPNVIPVEEAMVGETSNHHQVLRPVAAVPKEPVNVDELVGISHLSLVDSKEANPLPLSLKLTSEASRQSAFHANNATPVRGSDIGKGKGSPIQAV